MNSQGEDLDEGPLQFTTMTHTHLKLVPNLCPARKTLQNLEDLPRPPMQEDPALHLNQVAIQ